MSAPNNLIDLHSPPVYNDTLVPVFSGLRISASTNHPALKVRGDSQFYDQVNCCDALAVDSTLNVSGAVTLSSDVTLGGLSTTAPSASFQLYVANVSLADGVTSASVLCIVP